MCQGGGVEQPAGEASMGQASTIGLDIAKWVFQAHGADATGRVVFHKRLVRAKVLKFFAGQPPCLVALEACGGAHYWARELGKLGHTVCESAWNKDPVFGVIGIQTGPRGR